MGINHLLPQQSDLGAPEATGLSLRLISHRWKNQVQMRSRAKNESNHFYYADDNKRLQFESFLQNFPDEIDIISATELQEYIDSGEIKSELVLPISSLQNECHK